MGFVDFGVRVWESYRTSRSFGYRYGSVIEFTEAPGNVARAYRTHRSSGRVQKMLYPYPGYCGTGRTELTEVPGTGIIVIQNSQKFRVRILLSYRTHGSAGYWYSSLIKLSEAPGIVARACRTYRSSGKG